MKAEDIIFAEKPTYKNFRDLEGKIFTRWRVIGYAGLLKNKSNSKRQSYWWCECSCENKIIRRVNGNQLNLKTTKSCGCLQLEKVTTHGMRNSSEYVSFDAAKRRCQNSNHPFYKDYGGRGIEFKFNSFEEFYAELGDKPEPKSDYSVDRINNNGHYEVGNIRWMDVTGQNRNQRTNLLISINNITKCAEEWGEIYNITGENIRHRINRLNWCDYCAVTIPINKGRKRQVCNHKHLYE